MRKLILCLLLGSLSAVLTPTRALAQNDAVPLAIDNGEAVPDADADVAYETAVMPKDRQAAWAMLRSANGLHGDMLQPWYLHAHYKTYDAYGKSKGEGTLEYMWAGRNRWHVTYTEGATLWTRWKTEKGLYAPEGQPESPGFPESLLTREIQFPMSGSNGPKEAPAYMVDESFNSVTLTCFRTRPFTPDGFQTSPNLPPLQRVCTAQGKPWLRYYQGSYTAYFNKLVVFQHRIIADQINVRMGQQSVLDIDIDQLQLAQPTHMDTIAPPPNAVLLTDTTLFLPASTVAGRVVKKVPPRYPSEMKQQRVQGTVMLEVTITVEGKVVINGVALSPDPAFTVAAEQAVQQWIYQPWLKDGKPIEVRTTISVIFTMNR